MNWPVRDSMSRTSRRPRTRGPHTPVHAGSLRSRGRGRHAIPRRPDADARCSPYRSRVQSASRPGAPVDSEEKRRLRPPGPTASPSPRRRAWKTAEASRSAVPRRPWRAGPVVETRMVEIAASSTPTAVDTGRRSDRGARSSRSSGRGRAGRPSRPRRIRRGAQAEQPVAPPGGRIPRGSPRSTRTKALASSRLSRTTPSLNRSGGPATSGLRALVGSTSRYQNRPEGHG